MAIEHRGKNTWRVGVQFNDLPGRPWLRRLFKYPDTMTEDEQRCEAEKELAKLEADIEAGLVASPVPATAVPEDITPHSLSIEPPITNTVPAFMLESVNLPTVPAVIPGERYTIAQLADLWITNHVTPILEPTTAKTYINIMRTRLLPQLGSLYPEDLTPLVMAKLTAYLRKSKRLSTRTPDEQRKTPVRPSDLKKRTKNPDKLLSQRTVRNYIDVLDYMLEKSVEWKILSKNPLADAQKPAKKKTKAKFLDDDQAVRLLRLVGKDPRMSFRISVFLALMCSLRLGEVCGLSFTDINYKRGGIDIQRALNYTPQTGNYLGEPKSDAGERFINLPAGMLIMLRETEKYYKDLAAMIGDRWRGDGRIVCGWDGTPVAHDTPSKWFKAFADDNGFSGVTFHQLRHSHAAILFANNVDALAVAYRMGHEDAATTYRNYGHVIRSKDRKSADIMQDLLERSLQDDPDPDDATT